MNSSDSNPPLRPAPSPQSPAPRRLSHVLFDFFGTLVEYSASRTEQGYDETFALLRRAGTRCSYGEFLALWSDVAAQFDVVAEESLREYSMTEVAGTFLERAVGPHPQALVGDFVRTYVGEWSKGVRYSDEVARLLERLAGRFTLAVVTNTHDPELVPGHLARMGVAHHFERVVTSVEHGMRKPAPEIFHHAMSELGVSAEACVYVGDTYEADYRGARGAGIRALLIDPRRAAPIADEARLASIAELEARLSSIAG